VGFKERRELGDLPRRIESLEAERQSHFERMAAPGFYALPGAEIARARQRLAALEDDIHQAYARWMELDRLATSGEEPGR
jgi:ATP-binding cassette subfamily F protein uup